MGHDVSTETKAASIPTDRIDKEVVLKAPRSRVWKALTDAKEFGSWFGVQMQGAFASGTTMVGELTEPSRYAGLKLEFVIEAMEPETRFSYRWHPAALDKNADYSQEPMTLVVFTLDEVSGGTRLRVTETGFNALSAKRRAYSFPMNDSGWAEQLRRIEKYVSKS